MSNWKKIDSLCSKCGRSLEACPDYLNWGGLIIRGYEPMKYRHVDEYAGHNAKPYSDCGQYAKWMGTE